MKVAVVLLTQEDERKMASFLAANGKPSWEVVCWPLFCAVAMPEQWLPALCAASNESAIELILFPDSPAGDELATRLAWRLDGVAVCQALSYDETSSEITKAVYGNALIATLTSERTPLCLSLSRDIPSPQQELPPEIKRVSLPHLPQGCRLAQPEILTRSLHPLQSATTVVALGQGASSPAIAQWVSAINAEQGFTRQRVMAGGCDQQRMLGISGQRVAPEVCIIAGASGAPAFMAGISQSRFIVAINTDPDAPVFAGADIGIVGDAQEVLSALVDCASQVN